MRTMTAALLTCVATQAPAQAPPRPSVVAVADGDSVRLYVPNPPAGFRGFIVYGGAEMTRLTPEPVRPTTDPSRVADFLREQLDEVLSLAQVNDPAALLRKLDRDAFAANFLTLSHPRVAELLGRRWSDGRRGADTVATYRVALVDAGGRETGQSFTTRVRLRDVLPVAPSGATSAPQGIGRRITWQYPPYRDATDVTIGFVVYRARGTAPAARVSPFIVRDLDKAAHFDDTTAAAGTYTYTIRALDILRREGPPSAPLVVTATDKTAPAAPGTLVSTAGKDRVELEWQPVRDPDLAGYVVERSTGIHQAYTRVGARVARGARTTLTDTTLKAGTQYFYRVVAVDSAGNESLPSNPVSVLLADRTPPAPPTAVRATVAARHRVQLSWTGSTSSDAIGYYVYRGEAGREMTRVTHDVVAAKTFVDAGSDSSGLVPGRKYRVAVSAIDAAFNESPLVSVDVTIPDDVPPGPPTGFHAENVLGRYVSLGWSASISTDVKSFVLEKSTDGGTRVPFRDVSVTAARTLKDTAVVHGHRYAYSITAVDSAGNRSTVVTDTLTFRDPTPPPAPRNAYARRDPAGGVTVHWERVVDAELAGYVVYRSGLATGVYVKVTAAPVSALEWTDHAAPAGAWYTVRAVDRSGNESTPSPAVQP